MLLEASQQYEAQAQLRGDDRFVLVDDDDTLRDTIVFMCGMYFALHGGSELKALKPQQISQKYPSQDRWYNNRVVGHNTLGGTVKRLCSAAGIPATRLFQHGTDEQLIMKMTGHHSLDGIRAYKRVSNDQFKQMSSVLQNSVSGNSPTGKKRECCDESDNKIS